MNTKICGNCNSGDMTLCLDSSNKGVTVAYACEECGEVHFVCRIGATGGLNDDRD